MANQNAMTKSVNTKHISGLGEVAGFYDGVILDLWGVVHDGVKPFPDTLDTLKELKKSKRIVWLLSNAPRRCHVVAKHLEDMGIAPDLYNGLLTSGEATHQALQEKYIGKWGRKCFHLGPDRDKSVYEGLDLDIVTELKDADFVLNSGIYDHFNDTAEKYIPLLEEAASKNLPMICANPDKVVYVGDRLVLCPGTLAEMYEKLDGHVTWFGKPHRTVYSMVLAEMGLKRVLTIGDSMTTDVAGATGAGLDSGFITSGIHKNELFSEGAEGRFNETRLEPLFIRYPYRPTYVMDCFRW